MSIGSVIVTPTPTAGPLIAAITGFGSSKIRSDDAAAAVAVAPCVPRSACALALESNVSPPLAEVGAGAEAAARAGHDDHAHVVVGVGVVEGLDQLVASSSR